MPCPNNNNSNLTTPSIIINTNHQVRQASGTMTLNRLGPLHPTPVSTTIQRRERQLQQPPILCMRVACIPPTNVTTVWQDGHRLPLHHSPPPVG